MQAVWEPRVKGRAAASLGATGDGDLTPEGSRWWVLCGGGGEGAQGGQGRLLHFSTSIPSRCELF